MTTLVERAAARLGARPLAAEAIGSGDLSEVLCLSLPDGRRLVAKDGPAPRTEAAMLVALGRAGAPTPEVVAIGSDVLVMQAVPGGGGFDDAAWADLGRVLARLHATLGPGYGWRADYAFDAVTIPNGWCGDWPDFWARRRLLPEAGELPRPLRAGLEDLAARLPGILPAHPPASLLHGDLWPGNILVDAGRITGLIDPASYYGHSEADLAMLCLFARPPAAFWESHGAPAPGWERRCAVYQLWPAIVHLRLFGGGYRQLVERLLEAAGD